MAAAPAASAATGSGTAYNGACGSGYTVVNSAVGTPGAVYLTYNASTGMNCVVTVRPTTADTAYMRASVDVLGDGVDAAVDEGYYHTYAGPVYAYGRGMCVAWGGVVRTWEAYNSGSNCGARQQAGARQADTG